MEIVVDTSAVMAVVLNEDRKQAVLDRVDAMGLIAPYSLHWEVGNALSSLAKRKRMNIGACLQALGSYEVISLRLVDISLAGALDIACRHGIYAYDAYVIACAQEWELPLLTLDAEQASLARTLGVNVMEIDV